jgi:hypothetical protein
MKWTAAVQAEESWRREGQARRVTGRCAEDRGRGRAVTGERPEGNTPPARAPSKQGSGGRCGRRSSPSTRSCTTSTMEVAPWRGTVQGMRPVVRAQRDSSGVGARPGATGGSTGGRADAEGSGAAAGARGRADGGLREERAGLAAAGERKKGINLPLIPC